MSVHDETWDRPICEYCGEYIKYGQKTHHGLQICSEQHMRSAKVTWQPEPIENKILNIDFNDYSPPDFDEWFMGFVYQAARKSKDPKTKIGAVLVKNNEPIAICYNGFPRKVNDSIERYNDRELKRQMVCHAEENTGYLAAKRGVSTIGATLYTQGIPCNECTKGLINMEISEVVCHKQWPNLIHNENWVKSIEISKIMLEEAEIKIRWLDKVLGVKGYLDGKIINV